ncbi:hypothetical protein TNCV_306261 [Trichonephila clavipes]|nr:hypothetical protein TNCV_306261 [Trichonephila clavipes]
MRSGIIILENKGISNGSSVRDDMRSGISFAYLRPVKVPFRMILCRSVRPPMLIPPHTIQPALLYCDLSRTNAGLFQVPLSLHTRTRWVSHSRLNWDSSVNSTWLQSCCSQSQCSAAHLLSGRTVAWGQRNADHWPTCIEPSLMKPITYCLAEHPSSFAKSNCLCSCVAFSVLFQRAVNCIYRSSVDVVARLPLVDV